MTTLHDVIYDWFELDYMSYFIPLVFRTRTNVGEELVVQVCMFKEFLVEVHVS